MREATAASGRDAADPAPGATARTGRNRQVDGARCEERPGPGVLEVLLPPVSYLPLTAVLVPYAVGLTVLRRRRDT
ncbi:MULTISPECIES: hypothetical protein [Streptomyces]|uniref:Uncharacterized protein n=1 Tax=Streptomyces eurythermus TaxID=42237 RepID=A0ABW6YSL9_9ACTN|nr:MULTISPECIES: hypothetical protein [Streptomyces]QIS69133.1 hypothetical protein HB370_03290 [Streptomyces sp. DSM 40868]